MLTTIQGTEIELTPALKEYAEQKIADLDKFFDGIIRADIDLGLRSHHHQKGKIFYAEVNLSVPGRVMRVVKDEDDLYKAIDKVRDHFKDEFSKLKDKMRHIDKRVLRDSKAYHADDSA